MNNWSTRKLTLMFTILFAIIYTIADILVTWLNAKTGTAIYFDSTLTTEFFSFLKWIAGLGGGLTAVGMVTNNSKDEEEKG